MATGALRDIFFQECEDLMDALTDGISTLVVQGRDDDAVNAVFRAVHSIKGSAGAFGLTTLVQFAHRFETMLDRLRDHSLDLGPEVTRALQRAADVLSDLVDAARAGSDEVPAAMAAAMVALDDLGPGPDAVQSEEAVTFVPLAISLPGLDLPAPCPEEEAVGFAIFLCPTRELYDCGNDPAMLFSVLADLGHLEVCANLDRVPDTLDAWEDSFLSWDLRLVTDAPEAEVRAVFDFVEDLCTLRITPLLASEAWTGPNVPNPAPNAGAAPDHPGAAPELSPTPSVPHPPRKDPGGTLRVDLDRVDRLVNAVGELIINQAVIAQRIEDAGLARSNDLLQDLEGYRLLAREIQEGVMAIRAQPVKPLFQRMARVAREAAEATGKLVVLETRGEGTEVDKTLVERLTDPLTHMIRNAIDHGIERPADRVEAGKPESGVIRLSAEHRSGSVLIEVADDGAGLNRPRIREIAVKKGIIVQEAELSDKDIDNLLFAPGFSTAAEVTDLSGRGVGMDVVKTAITALGGRVSISSEAGKGATFTITMPLTLAVMDGMVINLGGQTMVVPITSIVETIRPGPRDISRIGVGERLVAVRGRYVPVIDLCAALGYPLSGLALHEQVLLLVRTERLAQCALAVDAISDQRQVVIKSLQGNYGDIPGISAATILGDGKIALIVDPDGIVSAAAGPSPIRIPGPAQPQEGLHA